MLSVWQPKVSDVRRVLVTEDLRLALRKYHQEHLSRLRAVHEGQAKVCLSASCQGLPKVIPATTSS